MTICYVIAFLLITGYFESLAQKQGKRASEDLRESSLKAPVQFPIFPRHNGISCEERILRINGASPKCAGIRITRIIMSEPFYLTEGKDNSPT